jgi:hypothetical protein
LFGASDRQLEDKIVEQAREYGGVSRDSARLVGPFATLAALVGAAAIGFVLGVLWKRR